MTVTANGKTRAVGSGTSVSDLLVQLGLDAARVVVEHNGEPLKRDRFSATVLQAGDALEIAQMVGGG
ncbi:MAG: thiamine biosynthesis protein ThiS [Candidatus Eremiobacter antarcticus]|nr:sulfur carrier protein ThiS [Candidatus Eremiobacteraeota bacterium]MBC5808550.1 sulfur carrier protein ThiS [Candidatus Eremiobacteraeota bacterium]PZR62888.1 MAG: thiamine biosynthesis protein ThiS [Candidatus Eremiobacter sp. RRmetagenome_bin22]